MTQDERIKQLEAYVIKADALLDEFRLATFDHDWHKAIDDVYELMPQYLKEQQMQDYGETPSR